MSNTVNNNNSASQSSQFAQLSTQLHGQLELSRTEHLQKCDSLNPNRKLFTLKTIKRYLNFIYANIHDAEVMDIYSEKYENTHRSFLTEIKFADREGEI